MIPVNLKEVERYMGLRGSTPSPQLYDEIDRCIQELEKVSQPRSYQKRLPLSFQKDGSFDIGPIHVISKDLARNLHDCEEVIFLCGTIGQGCDRLVRRAELTSLTNAAIFQAAGAAMVESWIDILNNEICAKAKEEGLFAHPRYSPGYGDCPLEIQKDLFSHFPLTKETGIVLNESLLMVPTKSVTAFIGLSKYCDHYAKKDCHACSANPSCIYRK